MDDDDDDDVVLNGETSKELDEQFLTECASDYCTYLRSTVL